MSRRLLLANSNSAGGKSITFYVNDIAYEAQAGMTWEEWVDSDYNQLLEDDYGNSYRAGKILNGYIYWAVLFDGEYDTDVQVLSYAEGVYYAEQAKDKIMGNYNYEAS